MSVFAKIRLVILLTISMNFTVQAQQSVTIVNTVAGPHKATLYWTKSNPTTNIRYSIYRGTSSSNLQLIDSNIVDTTYTNTALIGNQLYFYAIKAKNIVTNTYSTISNIISISPTKVWYVSTLGLNTNSGSILKPLKSIQYAVNYSVDGDTILLNNGNYVENIEIFKKKIVVKSINGPDYVSISSSDPAQAIFNIHSDWNFTNIDQCYIVGIKVQNCTSASVFRVTEQMLASIVNCYFYNNSSVFSTYYGYYNAQNCVFVNNNTLAYNDVGGSNPKDTFYHCTITKTKDYITNSNSSITNCFVNSILYDNRTNSNVTTDFNGKVILSNVIFDGTDLVVSATNVINQDPQFTDTKYIQVKNNSPAIGAGSVAYVTNKDYFNSIRPQPANTNPDLGAYESPYSYSSPVFSSIEGSNRKISITWTANNSVGVTRYRILRSTASIPDNANSGIVVDTLSLTRNTYLDSGLTNLTKYYYRIQAGNNAGVWSGMSNELSAYPNMAPSTPNLISANKGPRKVMLVWSKAKSINSLVKYNVYRSLTNTNFQSVKLSVLDTTFVDTGLTPGLKYFYQVRAVDTIGVTSTVSNILFVFPNRILYVSNAGDSSNIGNTQFPFKSIVHAMQLAIAGDTVIALPGIYYENISLVKDVVFGSKYIFNKDTSYIKSTILDGSNYFGNSSFIFSNYQYIKFEISGFTIQNSTSYAMIFSNYRNSKINACVFKNNGNSASWGTINLLGNVTLDSSYFYSNKGRYLVVLTGSRGNGYCRVSRSMFVNNGIPSDSSNWGDKGIFYLEQRGIVSNNIIYNNYMPAISTGSNGSLDTVYVVNNTIFKNKSVGLYFSNWGGGAFVNYINNIVENNKINVYYYNSGFSKVVFRNNYINPYKPNTPNQNNYNITFFNNDTTSSSNYVLTSTNFRNILSSSKIIGKGTLLNSPLNDVDGNIRPNPAGSNPDLGAYESPYKYASPILTELIGGHQKIQIKWTSNNSTGVVKYRILRSNVNIPNNAISTIIVDTLQINTNSYIDSGLTNLVKYYYRIQVGDNSGVWSALSNELSTKPNTPPTTPILLSISAGPRKILLKWNKSTSSNSSVKYNLYRSTSQTNFQLTKGAVLDTTAVDTGLVAGAKYYYQIRAVDTIGGVSSPSNILFGIPRNIWYVSNSGSNLNIGSKSNPVKTITYAVTKSSSQDSIILLSGVYAERINLSGLKHMLIGSEYVTTGDTSYIRTTTLDGSTLPNAYLIYDNNLAQSTVLKGFRIINSKGAIIGLNIASITNMIFENNNTNTSYGTDHLIRLTHSSGLSNNTIINCGNMSTNWLLIIYDSYSSNVSLDHNSFIRNKAAASIIIFNGSSPTSIKREIFSNVFIGNKSNYHTVYLDGWFRSKIYNNLFVNNSACAIGYNTAMDSTIIAHNTIVGNNYGIRVNSNGNIGVLIANNIIQNNKYYSTISDISIDGNASGTSIHQAKFVNNVIGTVVSDSVLKSITSIDYLDTTGSLNNFGSLLYFKDTLNTNYQLLNTSPLIGSGTLVSGITTDFDGNLRPNPAGSKPDIGAYETPYKYPAPSLAELIGGNQQIEIRWTKIINSGVTKYRIFRSTSPISDNANTGIIIDTLKATTATYLNSGLTNLTRYYYRIQAGDNSGIWSGMSNELSTKPNVPPTTPVLLSAVVGPRKVMLTWRKSTSNNSSVKYNLYRSTTSNTLQLVKTSITDSTITDTGLIAGTKYYYQVRAVDTIGGVSTASAILSAVPNNLWYVSLNGLNTNIGNISNPYRTIQFAVNSSRNGDTVLLNNGNYIENVEIFAKSITVKSINGPDSVSVSPFELLFPVFNLRANWDINNISRCYIVGIKVQGSSNVFRVTQRMLASIINSYFYNNGAVFSSYYGYYNVQNCVFVNNNTISNNDVGDSDPKNTFYHCTITQTTDFITNSNPAITSSFYNSIIYNNRTNSSSTTDFNGKVTLNNVLFDGSDVVVSSSNVINQNPQFLDAKCIQLKNNSPAIGAGSMAYVINKDYFNSSRPLPSNSNPDLGASENANAIPTTNINKITSQANTLSLFFNANIGATKYLIYRDTVVTPTTLVDSLSGSPTSYIDNNVQINKRYYYSIKCVNNIGLRSGYSNVVNAVVLVKPSILSPIANASNVDTSIVIRTKKNVNATKYYFQLSADSFLTNTYIKNQVALDTFISITALTRNKFYYARVKSISGTDTSAWSSISRFQTKLSIPKITTLSTSDHKIRVNWTHTPNTNTHKYYIYRSQTANATVLIDSVAQGIFSYIDSNVLNNKFYYYRIVAVNPQKVLSAYSNEKRATALNLTTLVLPSNRQVNVVLKPTFKWNVNTFATGYRFQYSLDSTFASTLLDVTQSDTQKVMTTNLSYNTNYYWRVKSVDSLGSSNWSNFGRFQTGLSVPKITTLSTSDHKIKINWTHTPNINILKYYVYRSESANATVLIDSVVQGIYSYTDSSVLNNKLYYYRISAVNLQKVLSAYSNERRATALGIPSHVLPSNRQVNVVLKPTFKWNVNTFATGYRFQYSLDSTFASTLLDVTQSDTQKVMTTNLSYNTNYYWRVKSVDSLGSSNWSTFGRFQTELSVPKITTLSTSDRKIQINWTHTPNTNILKYYIYRSQSANATVLIDSVVQGIYSYTDSSVLNNKLYYYRISAVNLQKVLSVYSNERRATALGIPSHVLPSNRQVNVALKPTFKWNANTFATGYRIQYSLDSTFTTTLLDVTQSDTQKVMTTNLSYNTNYYWRVKSADSLGSSNWSTFGRFQTELSVPKITTLSTSDHKIRVNWTHTPNTNILKYYIYRSESANATVLIDSVAQGIYSYTDSSVLNNKLYYYRISAVNQQKILSVYSNERRATALGVLSQVIPTNNQLNTSLNPTLKWNKNNFATQYRIQYSSSSSFITPLLDELVVDTQKTIINNLNYNEYYYWRVRSVDTLGVSNWSNTNSFETKLDTPILDSVVAGNHSNKLYWSYSNISRIKNFGIYRFDTASKVFTLLDTTLNNSAVTYTDDSLDNDVVFRYAIKAMNYNRITSNLSNAISASPFNISPVAVKLQNVYLPNQGRKIATMHQFSSIGSYDLDNTIDSVVWYVNNKRILNATSLNYGFRQGTSKVLMKVYDSDLAEDSSIATVTINTFVKNMNGPVYAGLTAATDNLIYAADYSYINGLGAKTIQIDSTGKTNFDLIVTQQIRTTPSVTSDSSVLITNGSLLNGFTKTGTPLFGSISLGGLTDVTPTIDSALQRIYVGVSNKKFFAINYKLGGMVAWDYTCDAPIVSSAVITSDRKLIFPDQIGNIYGFDITTSTSHGSIPKWKYNLNDTITTSPAIDINGNVYVGTKSGKLAKLTFNANGTVTVNWSSALGSKVTSSPIIDGNGFIYVGCENGKLYKLKNSTGSIVWDYNSGAAIRSTPAISNKGFIYFSNEQGLLSAVDTTSRLYWYYKDSTAINANILHISGTTYIGTLGGKVIAFWDKDLSTYGRGVSSAVTEPSWGTYQGNNRRSGIQVKKTTTVGIQQDQLLSTIKLYPNPTHDIVYIDGLPENKTYTLQVFDMLGKLIETKSIENKGELDLSNYNVGVYIIRINNVVYRVIKQ